MKLIQKSENIIRRAHEIIRVAMNPFRQVPEWAWNLLRCGIFLFVITGCSGKGTSHGGDGAGVPSDKSNPVRMLRRGLPGEPRTLNPQLAEDTFSFPVLRDLYEGLTAEDRNGHAVPGAAQSWTVDGAGTIYTFQLRPNARWSDGDRIVANEFVQALRRAVDPKTASGSSALLTVIKSASEIIAGKKAVTELGVTAAGESSVRIELEHPAPFVLQILSEPIAAPTHIRGNPYSAIPESTDKSTVSNGPYTLASRILGSYIELARNPYYWDASHVQIERVRYVNAESEATEIREYVAGQLEMTSTIPAPVLERVTQKYGAEIQTAPILGTLYLALECFKTAASGRSRSSPSPVDGCRQRFNIRSRNYWCNTGLHVCRQRDQRVYAPSIPVVPMDSRPPASIRTNSIRQIRVFRKKPLHLILYFNSGESIQRIMIAIAASWKKNLGIATDLVSDEFRVFLEGRKDHSRWNVARLGWYADYDDPSSFLDVFSRNNVQNDPGYVSTEFNNLIDAARIEPNPDKRMLLLQKSEEVLLDDYPIIPVYFYMARRLVKPYLGGAAITPLNHTYSKHLYWKSGS